MFFYFSFKNIALLRKIIFLIREFEILIWAIITTIFARNQTKIYQILFIKEYLKTFHMQFTKIIKQFLIAYIIFRLIFYTRV